MSTLEGRGQGDALAVPLDPLAAFLGDVEQPITFGDAQAVLGMDLADARKAVGLLRAVGVLERFPKAQLDRPRYRLTPVAVHYLGNEPTLPAPEAGELVTSVMESARRHNTQVSAVRVRSVSATAVLANSDVSVQLHVSIRKKESMAADFARFMASLEPVMKAAHISVIFDWQPTVVSSSSHRRLA